MPGGRVKATLIVDAGKAEPLSFNPGTNLLAHGAARSCLDLDI